MVELIRSLGSDFVIQEIVNCHESIAVLFPKAVNTFRVTTYRWKGKLYHMPLAMRLGRGNLVVDNVTSGGMFIGVNNDGSLCEEALTISGDRIHTHPDTKVVFKNHVLYGIHTVIDAAIRLHCMVPQLGVIGWDFTVGDDGKPVLIEANVYKASYRLGMMAHGVSPFLERTPEVLQWVGKMSKLPASKRQNYLFGAMD